MKRHLPRLASLLLVFIWFAAVGLPHTLAAVPQSGQELTLLYANDVNGETEPCG